MATYSAGDLLAQLQEIAIKNGDDATAVRAGFIADNNYSGTFNPNLSVDVQVPLEQLSALYAKKLPLPGSSPTSGSGLKVRKTASGTTYPSEVIDNVLMTAQKTVDRGGELMSAIQGTTAKVTEGSDAAIQAAENTGKARATAITAKGAQDVQRNDFVTNMLSALGLDATDPNSMFRDNLTQAAKAQQEVHALAPQIQAARNVNFADDPIGWVKSQFTLQSLSDKHNAAAKVFNDNVGAVGAMQQVAAQQQAMQPGVSKDAIAAQAAAEAEAAVAEAQLRQFQIKQAVRSAELSSYSTEFQFLNMQFQQASGIAHLLAQRSALTEVEGVKDKEQLEINLVNMWRDQMKLQPLTALQYKAMDAKERTKMLELASRTSLNIADSPGEALNVLYDFKAFSAFRDDLSEVARPFLEKMTVKGMADAKALKQLNPRLSDEEAFKEAINTQYKRWRDELTGRNYDKLSADNPYRMNATVFAQAPALKNNTVAQYVLSTPSGGAGLQVKDVLGWAAAQVQAGKPTEQVAKEVKQFFFEGTKQQFVDYRMSTLGFDLRNPKKGNVEFPVDGNVFGFFDRVMDPRKANSSTKDLQLFDEMSIIHFLTLNAVQAKAAAADKSGLAGLKRGTL
jgi:hypothetical protein